MVERQAVPARSVRDRPRAAVLDRRDDRARRRAARPRRVPRGPGRPEGRHALRDRSPAVRGGARPGARATSIATARARPRRSRTRSATRTSSRRTTSRAQQADQADADASAALSTLKADEAAVQNAELDLSYCTITAPIAGRVGSFLVHAGNMVKANDDSRSSSINQIQPIYVTFAVPETSLARDQGAASRRDGRSPSPAAPSDDPTHVADRASSRSSTTRSIRRPARSSSRRRSRTRTSRSGRASS